MAALQWTTLLNVVLVVGLPDIATTAGKTIQILERSKATGAVVPPSFIEDICHNPRGLCTSRKLDDIYFVAELLLGYNCKVQPVLFSTEVGGHVIQIATKTTIGNTVVSVHLWASTVSGGRKSYMS